MPYRPTQFQLTIVKPYYKDNSFKPIQDALEDALEDAPEDAPENAQKNAQEENHDQRTLKGDYDSNTIIVDVP